jgi:hypothetical protein
MALERAVIKKTCFLTAAACSALALTGCGGTYESAVSGVVKLDGNLIDRGTVSFAPQGAGAAAFGVIESDGRYALSTGREEGLPSGQYLVTVAANKPPASLRNKDGGPAALGEPITPEWYRNPATSGLTYTVEPGDNEINIELNTTPPPGWKPPPGRR